MSTIQHKKAPLLQTLIAFISGTLFGLGLITAQMVDTQKVLNFLDFFGQWDPSLALVMAAGLSVFSLGYKLLVKPKSAPLLDQQFFLPTKTQLDKKLILGAALFGLGWGLVGICPGPAIVNLTSLSGQFIGFFLAMLAGIIIAKKITQTN